MIPNLSAPPSGILSLCAWSDSSFDFDTVALDQGSPFDIIHKQKEKLSAGATGLEATKHDVGQNSIISDSKDSHCPVDLLQFHLTKWTMGNSRKSKTTSAHEAGKPLWLVSQASKASQTKWHRIRERGIPIECPDEMNFETNPRS